LNIQKLKGENMKNIENSFAVLSKFNRSIKLNLIRFGTRKFGFVCEQTGKKLFLEWPTRLSAAVGIASRYYTCQSYDDRAFVNPKSVAEVAGPAVAFDLLLACGFIKI
jgi:hypothetical protein